MLFITTLTLAVCLASCQQLIPTQADLDTARVTINGIIDAKADNNEFPFIAGFVRLAFHDCVGPGHCDGCINHTIADNKGLKTYTDELDPAYDLSYSTKMSRADFYMFAAYVALERASEGLTDTFQGMSNFKVGREDCGSSPNETEAPGGDGFPKGTFELHKVLDFFKFQFNFTDRESVAILGAHTLGRTRVENSGFEGKWVRGTVDGKANSDILDNQFYRQLRGNWTQVEIAQSGKMQWQRPNTVANSDQNRNRRQPNMFLNSDIAIAWNLTTLDGVAANGAVTCKVVVQGNNCIAGDECCDKSPTNQNPLSNNIFRTYVNSNTAWLQDFTNAFHKMTHLNDANLVPPA